MSLFVAIEISLGGYYEEFYTHINFLILKFLRTLVFEISNKKERDLVTFPK